MNQSEVLLPDLQAALVCEDVRLEASGSNTLVGVINVIAAPTIPFRIIKLCVFTRWTNGEGRFLQKTRILSPLAEDVIAESDTGFHLESPSHHATNVAFFGGLEFAEWGDYPVEILLNGDLVSRFTVKVVQVQPPAS
ncbi:MAG: hypothetical protein OHK005_13970 [Candidatus Methylacidiphilales bacterium]